MTLKNEDILQMKQDQYISDIIDIEINSEMPVSTLYALETIFFLRLQLAQASGDEREPSFAALCRERFEQILEALLKKYPSAGSINEKIEILERIETITLFLSNDHNCFALEEAAVLEDLPDLTYSQRLRLSWMPVIDAADCDAILATLLPQVKDAFDIATLSLIKDFCTDAQRNAVMRLYKQQFNAALQTGDTAELGKLLTIAAYWNSYPQHRGTLAALACQVANLTDLTLPEKRVNHIAAEIYTRIDPLTGKYKVVIESLTA